MEGLAGGAARIVVVVHHPGDAVDLGQFEVEEAEAGDGDRDGHAGLLALPGPRGWRASGSNDSQEPEWFRD